MERVAGTWDDNLNSIKCVHSRLARINVFHAVISRCNMLFPRTYNSKTMCGYGAHILELKSGLQMGEATCNWTTTTCKTEKNMRKLELLKEN
jgi:hypothetical protein